MRKMFWVLIVAFAGLCLSGSWLSAQDFGSEKNQVKDRQKAEHKAMKLKHKFTKQSLGSRDVPTSQRQMMKHQMDREQRELRERHRDELQDLKDRQRALKESQEML